MSDTTHKVRHAIAQRLDDAGLGADRFIDVVNGGKRSFDHEHRGPDALSGNYGIRAAPTDALVLLDVDDYDDAAAHQGVQAIEALPATLSQESPHGGTHHIYGVRPTADGRLVAAVLDETFGSENLTPSWGEVRAANQYVVGAGSVLDDCDKEWCDACATDGGRYELRADRPIEILDPEDLVAALRQDPDLDTEPDDTGGDTSATPGATGDGNVSIDERLRFARERDDTLARLLDGDYSAYDGDRSKAEYVLAFKLAFWLGGDKRRVREAIEQHANTKKWAERPDDSYRESVLSAVDEQTERYDPGRQRSGLDAVDGEGGGEADDAGEPSAGDPPDGPSLGEQLHADVLVPFDPPDDVDIDPISAQTAIDRAASLIASERDWLFPRGDVPGWRSVLYNYTPEHGIYEPHGSVELQRICERHLRDFLTNQRFREIERKVKIKSLTTDDDLDPHPGRLAVRNGILDLRTGELKDHTPAEHHRVFVDVAYTPDADPDRIDDFFREIVPEDDVPTLYRLAAHCLYREYAAEKAAMLVGDGQNGKSVYLALLRQFLGSENVTGRSLHDLNEERFALNALHGKLANMNADLGDTKLHDISAFKRATGRDELTADVKYEKPVEFENHATLLFAANQMPAMAEDTYALWRRWIYINFPNTFAGDDQIPKRVLLRELTTDEELSGLLARCVDEISAWWDGRDWFPDQPPVSEVREHMKRASEPVYDFAAACLEEDDDGAIPKADVRDAYRAYAEAEDLPRMAENVFGERMLNLSDYAITEERHRGENGERVQAYAGISWSSRGRQVAGLDAPDDGQEYLGGQRDRREAIVQLVRENSSSDAPISHAQLLGYATDMAMTKDQAEAAIDDARDRGDIYTPDGDGYRPS